MSDAPPLTPLLLDCHGGVAGSEFKGIFKNLLQCLRDRLRDDAGTIDEGPQAIPCPKLAWRAYLGAGDRSLMEFRARFNSLPAQGYVGASEYHRARSSSRPPSAAPAPPAAPHALGEVPPAVGARPVSRSALAGTLLDHLVPCQARPCADVAEPTTADETPALTFAPLTATTWKPVVDALEEALRATVIELQRPLPCSVREAAG